MATGFATKTVKTKEIFKTAEEREAYKYWTGMYGGDFKKYWDEWIESAIAPEMIIANLIPVGRNEAHGLYEIFTPDPYKVTKRVQPDAQWRALDKRFGKNWNDGGWFCQSVDPRGGLAALKDKDTGEVLGEGWGCFKPETPRMRQKENGKLHTIKYEHPIGVELRLIYLQVPVSIWEKICDRNGLPHPDFSRVNFWQWVIDSNVEVWVTEGAKKAASLLSEGIVAIAGSGINAGYRKLEEGGYRLHDDFQPLLETERKIVFCFDYENPITKPDTCRFVNLAIDRTGGLLEGEGAVVEVAKLPGKEKGVDDFIASRNAEDLQQLCDNKIPLGQYLAILDHDRFYNLSGATEIIDSERLTPLAMDGAKILGIKSAKATGKTHQMVQMVKKHRAKGGKAIVVTHRIQLAQHLCERFNIPHISILKDQNGYFIGYGCCIDSLHGKSSFPFTPETFQVEDNPLLILDECEQVLHHAVYSSTAIKDNRGEILFNLGSLVRTCVNSEFGGVVLSDADLTDVSVDYVKDVSGRDDVETKIVGNEHKPCVGRDAYLYKTETGLLHALVQSLEECRERKQAGVFQRAIAIYTQAQKKKSKLSASNLARLLRTKFKDLRVLVIDAVTSADPKHPAHGLAADPDAFFSKYHRSAAFTFWRQQILHWLAFNNKLGLDLGTKIESLIEELLSQKAQQLELWADNEKSHEKFVQDRTKEIEEYLEKVEDLFFVPEEKVEEPYDVILFTPVIETGVSIDTKGYFWKQFGVVLGVNAPASARQGLARVREGCDRHVYCVERGLQYVGNKYLTWKAGVIKSMDRRMVSLITSSSWDGTDLTKQEMIAGFKASVANQNLYGSFGARTNQESSHYYDSFVCGLGNEGYNIIEVEKEELSKEQHKSYKEEIKENKDEAYNEEVDQVVAQPNFESHADYEKSKARETKTEAQRQREKKHEVQLKYGLNATVDIVKADDDGFTRKLKNFYYLSQAEEECYARDRRHVDYQIEKNKDGQWLMSDFLSGTSSSVVKLLKELDILSLVADYDKKIDKQNCSVGFKNAEFDYRQKIEASQKTTNSNKQLLQEIENEKFALEVEYLNATTERQREIDNEFDKKTSEAERLESENDVELDRRKSLREELGVVKKLTDKNIEELVDSSFTNEDAALVLKRERILERREEIQALLGITIPTQIAIKEDGEIVGYKDSTPIQVIAPLLNQIGFKPSCVARKGKRGEERSRSYLFVPQHLKHPAISQVFEGWQRKEEERRAGIIADMIG